MKFRTFVLMSLIGALCYTCMHARNVWAGDRPKERAYDRVGASLLLMSTTTFADRAVGYGGTKPDQIIAYQLLLAEKDSPQLFRELVARGKLAGQLYGLVGLYATDRKEFDRLLPQYAKSKDEVDTFFGCMRGPLPVAEVVKEIADGSDSKAFAEP